MFDPTQPGSVRSVIPALGKVKQEHQEFVLGEFEVSLG